jgi:hypothetical protein
MYRTIGSAATAVCGSAGRRRPAAARLSTTKSTDRHNDVIPQAMAF